MEDLQWRYLLRPGNNLRSAKFLRERLAVEAFRGAVHGLSTGRLRVNLPVIFVNRCDRTHCCFVTTGETFIIADDLFSVGDYVKIGEVTGRVVEMEMRVTRLQDLNGKVYLFSNGDIGMITNLSRNPVEEFIEIQLAYNADINAATDCINKAGEAMLNSNDSHLKAAPCTIGTSSFNVTSISLRVSVSANPRYLNIEMMRVREAIRLALNKDRIPLA